MQVAKIKLTGKRIGDTDRAVSRRQFIDTASRATITSAIIGKGFPSIVAGSVFGEAAPSNRITVGAIGTGRISRGHDLPGGLKQENTRGIAVCDLDKHRVQDAQKLCD